MSIPDRATPKPVGTIFYFQVGSDHDLACHIFDPDGKQVVRIEGDAAHWMRGNMPRNVELYEQLRGNCQPGSYQCEGFRVVPA